MHCSSCLMAPLRNKAEQSVLVVIVSFSSVLSSFGHAARASPSSFSVLSDWSHQASSFCSSARLTNVMLSFCCVATLYQ